MSHPFLWGAATSAHQVEGNNVHSDWWAWEKATPGVARSGAACDHYERFRDDFALARTLGHNAHRLSLEWSRIEFAEDTWSEKAIQHYREVLLELKKQGLTSFVTLHHFTNPEWLARQGGWENPRVVYYFTRYAQRVVNELGDLVDFWLTINEPNVYLTHSYWHKRWPPQKHSLIAMLKVRRHLAKAHNHVYEIIRKQYPSASVGMAHSVVGYLPANPNSWADRLAVSFHNWLSKDTWYSLTAGSHDFLGLNYYFSVTKQVVKKWPFVIDAEWQGAHSDLGWPIRSEGLTDILLQMRRYQLPIYITENGIADATDTHRPEYIRAHIRAIEAAQSQGADVRGYLHWSLLDNFEWDKGFGPRFGLVKVDFETQERTVRPSAYVYKAIIDQSLRR